MLEHRAMGVKRALADEPLLPLDAKRRAAPAPVAFRLLCPVDRIGALIGHGGDVIASLRASTGARVKLDPPAARCRDRVLHVSAGPAAAACPACPATAALLAAHDRLTHGDGGGGGGADPPPPPPTHAEARLLVDAASVGALLGRRGAAIQALRAATGACVRVLPAKELPAVAAPGDELVRIAGAPAAVAAALARVAATLRATPPRRVGGGPAGLLPPPADLVAALGAAGLGPGAEWGDGSPHARAAWPDAGSADAEPASPPASPLPLVPGLLPPALEALLAGPPSPTRASVGSPTRAAAASPCRSSAGSAAFAASPLARRGVGAPWAADPAAMAGSPHATSTSPPTTPLSASPPDPAAATVTYRLLVPAQAVGAVLGRGGDTVRRVRRDTGAWVKVHPAPPGAAVRIVQASSPAAPSPTAATCPASVALITAVGLLLADGGAGRARHAVRLLAPRRDAVAALAAGGGAAALASATGAVVTLDRPTDVGCPVLTAAALAGRDDDAVVTIDGGAAAVGAATQLVAALLRGVAVRAAAAACATPSSSSLAGGASSLPASPLCAPARSPTTTSNWPAPATAAILSLSRAQADALVHSLPAVATASGASVRVLPPLDPASPSTDVELRGGGRAVAAAKGMLQAFLLAAGAPPLVD